MADKMKNKSKSEQLHLANKWIQSDFSFLSAQIFHHSIFCLTPTIYSYFQELRNRYYFPIDSFVVFSGQNISNFQF